MASVSPFAALMPTPERAAAVSAVPYDVVNTAEARELATGNPFSFLHVSRPEIGLADDANPYADSVYALALANFDKLKTLAPLVQDEAPRYYVYSLEMQGRRQTGIVAACSVDDYDADIIKKHEKTRKDKEDDRTRHVTTTRCHSGPVFLLYPDRAEIDRLTIQVENNEPALFDIRGADGVRHVIYPVPTAHNALLQAAFAAVPTLYVADGHHRAKSASRAREACRAANPAHTGKEAYNRFLAVLFPASQLRILPYNRVVHDLNGSTAAQFISAVRANHTVVDTTEKSPAAPGSFHMYLGGAWYAVTPKDIPADLAVDDRLDVSLLQNGLLAPILGIDDPRTNKRIDFVGGIRGTAELEKLVNSGKAAVAFSMCPTTVQQLIDISDAGKIMPPKSTWFEPKLRDGLLLHCY